MAIMVSGGFLPICLTLEEISSFYENSVAEEVKPFFLVIFSDEDSNFRLEAKYP